MFSKKEYMKEYNKHYWYKHKHKEKRKEYRRKYRKTHTEKLKKDGKAYYHTLNGKKKCLWAMKKYRQTIRGKTNEQKHSAERRKLGHISLNKPFPGCHFHHVTNNKGVNIQDKVHMMFIGYDRKTHRRLVLAYYGSLKKMIENARQLKLF